MTYNPETQSEREIRLSQLKFNPFDEKLTDASLILAKMQRGQLSAFDEARKMFHWLNEKMTYKEIYNAVYGYVRFGFSRRVHQPTEGDEYASSEEWSALFKWSKKEAFSSRNSALV